jgi:hypothetical protein
MPGEKKADMVTAYVLARLAELDATRGATAEALRRGGLSRSAASVLRNGSTDIGAAREPGWAKALGFADVEQLRLAAVMHAMEERDAPLTAAQREAIEQAKPLGQMTNAEAVRIVRRAWQYADRPAEWWLSHILAEYKYIRDQRAGEERERRAVAEYQAQVRATKAPPAPAPETPKTTVRKAAG